MPYFERTSHSTYPIRDPSGHIMAPMEVHSMMDLQRRLHSMDNGPAPLPKATRAAEAPGVQSLLYGQKEGGIQFQLPPSAKATINRSASTQQHLKRCITLCHDRTLVMGM